VEPAAAAFRAILTRWVEGVRRRAVLVLVLSLAAAAGCGWYAATHTVIDTNTNNMLSPDLPFQRDADRMSKAFPQLEDPIVVVIDAANADQADDAARRLSAALRGKTDAVRSVFYAEGDPFFRRNGLLYLEPDQLAQLTDRLAGAQAFLGALWHDPSLRGLFTVLGLALANVDQAAPPTELATVVNAVAGTVENVNAGRPGTMSWSELLASQPATGQNPRRSLVLVQPKFDYTSLQPAGHAIDTVRATAESLGLTPANGVTVRLTGSPPLNEEELSSVVDGMGVATGLSMALVLGLLFWGLKSTRMALGNLLTLIVGLAWTAGFAAVAVGRLNLLSIAFAVLFIGLSVDFGIHFALRVREAMERGDTIAPAMRWAVETAGGPIALCAVAAAISFYSFMPTDYLGLAELGLIAGTSMIIALFANFTVLPAIMVLVTPRLRHALRADGSTVQRSAGSLIIRHSYVVMLGAGILAIAGAALVPQARFDFDPIDLKDPSSESVMTLHDLMTSGQSGAYDLGILAPNAAAAQKLAQRLQKLPEVKTVTTIDDYIPKDQDAKLAIIDQAALFLLPAFQGDKRPPPSAAERKAAVEKLRTTLDRRLAATNQATPLTRAMRRLDDALAKLKPTPAALAGLDRRLISNLPTRLDDLRESLQAKKVTAADLPASLRNRMVTSDGRVRVEVAPRGDVHDRAALARFVDAVQSIAPHATGAPAVIIGAANTIVGAFLEAGAISIAAIAVLILIILRRPGEVALVFAPLVIAALLTVAAAVLLGMPFNYANIIVLPLLFGLGVASGINLVMRARLLAPRLDSLFESTTPRAVIFSALTTIASFGTMGFSGHRGTASMGILLAIALALTMTTSVIVLPALLAIFGVRRASHAE
jgi:hopanoid biosynthesis associated RND transporter like protein HpnN